MTNEQAKSELMQIYGSLSEEKKKALDVLMAQADGEYISRQAVCDILEDIRDCISVDGYWAILERLKKLPSVKPQEKTGHWIYRGGHDTYYGLDDYDCSECESHVSVEGDEPYDYCPYCGAKMD